MSTLAIELNDAGVTAVGEPAPSEPVVSPGYALLDGGGVRTGQEAAARARLTPRRIHHRFWEELDTAPLARPFPRELSAADLAHAHLREVWQAAGATSERVLLAVPGCFAERQLGLLLGVARAAGLPVTGLVDAAVAAAAAGYPGHKLVHLDLHLHRAVASELTQGRELVRGRVEVAADVGLAALYDAWVRRIAELFVGATRFDPLHFADSEQLLYDRLPGWLAKLRRHDAVTLVMESDGGERGVELTRRELTAAVAPLYRRLADLVRSLKRAGEPVTVLVSHRLAALPELVDRLAELRGAELLLLPPAAAAKGALRLRRVLESGGEALPFVVRLALPDAPSGDRGELATRPAVLPPVRAAAAAAPPTHLLLDGRAHPVTTEPFPLVAGAVRCAVVARGGEVVVEDPAGAGVWLNGERVAGSAALAVGDRLRLGEDGVEVQLIAVVGAGGGRDVGPGPAGDGEADDGAAAAG